MVFLAFPVGATTIWEVLLGDSFTQFLTALLQFSGGELSAGFLDRITTALNFAGGVLEP